MSAPFDWAAEGVHPAAPGADAVVDAAVAYIEALTAPPVPGAGLRGQPWVKAQAQLAAVVDRFRETEGAHPLVAAPDLGQLYDAVHAMLVTRLLRGQDSLEFLEAINDVIAAHDRIAEIYQRAFGDS